MVLWHVTSAKKFGKYMDGGCIKPPVRAWKSISAAERFSKQTGRRLILRLKWNPSFIEFEGHQNEAVISHQPYVLQNL